jgi:hypothetical protein
MAHFSKLLSIIIIPALVTAACNQNDKILSESESDSIKKILNKVHQNDQKYRLKIEKTEIKYGMESEHYKKDMKTILHYDSINTKIVSSIIDSYGWLGKDEIGHLGNSTLFLVIQHADLTTQKKYLHVLKDAVKKGNAEPFHLAYLEDRIRLKLGQKQIYGTQATYDSIKGDIIIAPIEDSINVDKRREQIGLPPLEVYLSGMNNRKDSLKEEHIQDSIAQSTSLAKKP